MQPGGIEPGSLDAGERVIRLLGYRKTMPSQLRLSRAEDWRESADAPAEVRPKRRDDQDNRKAA